LLIVQPPTRQTVTVILSGWLIEGRPVERPLIALSFSLPPANKIIVIPLGHQ
jgi:hypothetical protein